jgi:hypothetical protein
MNYTKNNNNNAQINYKIILIYIQNTKQLIIYKY